jgi:hypothetical protein
MRTVRATITDMTRQATTEPGRLPLVAGVLTTGLLTAALLGACSGSGPEPGPTRVSETSTAATPEAPEGTIADAGDDDVCALLPPEQLEAILGEAAQATPVPTGDWASGQCAWSGPRSGFFLSMGTEASISAFEDPAEPDAHAKLDAFTARQADAAREVPDIGDGAVAGPSGMAATVGSDYLEVEVLSLTEEQLHQIMQLAVGSRPAS